MAFRNRKKIKSLSEIKPDQIVLTQVPNKRWFATRSSNEGYLVTDIFRFRIGLLIAIWQHKANWTDL